MGLLESIKNIIIGEKIDKPFLEQPINKIDATVPFGRVINTLSDDEPLRFQTFFDNVNDITYVDNLQKASEQAQKIDIYRQNRYNKFDEILRILCGYHIGSRVRIPHRNATV